MWDVYWDDWLDRIQCWKLDFTFIEFWIYQIGICRIDLWIAALFNVTTDMEILGDFFLPVCLCSRVGLVHSQRKRKQNDSPMDRASVFCSLIFSVWVGMKDKTWHQEAGICTGHSGYCTFSWIGSIYCRSNVCGVETQLMVINIPKGVFLCNKAGRGQGFLVNCTIIEHASIEPSQQCANGAHKTMVMSDVKISSCGWMHHCLGNIF